MNERQVRSSSVGAKKDEGALRERGEWCRTAREEEVRQVNHVDYSSRIKENGARIAVTETAAASSLHQGEVKASGIGEADGNSSTTTAA